MLLEITDPALLYAFGWKTFPTYVRATPAMWLHWMLRG